MAASLRAQRVETLRLCEDRRQLLELTLIQLRDANRLQPKTIDLGELNTFEIDVKAVLEAEKSGADVDLSQSKFVHVSAADEDERVELVSEFRLEGAQLSLAAYEMLILFMRQDNAPSPGLPRTSTAEREDDEELLDEIRLNLLISSKQYQVVRANLEVEAADLPSGMREQPIDPTSLHYRFQMLAARRPEHFDDDAAFEKWQERQMSVFMMGLHGEFDAAGYAKGEPLSELQETIGKMFQQMLDISRPDQGRIQTRKSEGFPAREYAQCIEHINTFLCSIIYPQFAPHRRGGSDGCKGTPHAFPLNVAIYGKLFETCFDAESRGTFSAQGQSTLEFLTRDSFRARLDLTDQVPSPVHCDCPLPPLPSPRPSIADALPELRLGAVRRALLLQRRAAHAGPQGADLLHPARDGAGAGGPLRLGRGAVGGAHGAAAPERLAELAAVALP